MRQRPGRGTLCCMTHPPPPLPLAMHEIHVSVVSAEDASRGLAQAHRLLALY
jgi:hypothetical protein